MIVRPSYVIGGLAIDFAYTPDDLARQLERIGEIATTRPLRIDRFLGRRPQRCQPPRARPDPLRE
ncbi:MAG: hypothetical protein ACKN93_06120 [Candidatus Limnocylindrus sp.]